MYREILDVDSENTAAKTAVRNLKKQYPDLPPRDAFRLSIEESDNPNSTTAQLPKNDEDFSKLIIPNKLVKSKLSKVSSSVKKLTENAGKNVNRLKEKRENVPACELTLTPFLEDRTKAVKIQEIFG